MKYRIVLDAPIEKLFPALISPTIEGFRKAKKRNPTEEELEHGLKFQVEVQNSKQKRFADVRILKYEKPHVFSMEYRSSTFHKIDTVWLKETAKGKTEVITEHYEEKIRDGKIISSKGKEDPDRIRPVSFWERRKYQRLAYAVRKGMLEF